MSRRRHATPRTVDPTLAYVRDVDTPVVFADVVRSLQRLTELADLRDDQELASAARHVHALVVALRAQFVADLIGDRRPSETTIGLERARSPRRTDHERAAGAWMRAAR